MDLAASAEQALLAAVANSGDAVGVLSAVRRGGAIVDFRVDYLNAAAGARIGMPRSSCQGQLLSTLAPTAQSFVRLVDCVRALRTGEPLTCAVPGAAEPKEPANSAVHLRPVPAADQVVMVWPDRRDPTSADRPAAAGSAPTPALLRRIRRLEESNRELAHFAYVASHDLSEPLRTIAGFADLLAHRYRGQLDDQADEFLDYITAGTARLKAMIDSLLAYSRVETRPQRCERVDCGLLVADVLDSLRDKIDRTAGDIEVEPLPTVLADPTQLGQVLQNLLANALTYTRPDSPPRVVVRAKAENSGWRFEVEDNGVGIAPADRQRIFGMFQRLGSRSEGSGTGMGLAISKKIVERHGGHIWVEDNPAGGCRFCFTLDAGDDAGNG